MQFQRLDNGAHTGADREVVRNDFNKSLAWMAGQDPLQRINQIKEGNFVEQTLVFLDLDRRTGLARKHIPP